MYFGRVPTRGRGVTRIADRSISRGQPNRHVTTRKTYGLRGADGGVGRSFPGVLRGLCRAETGTGPNLLPESPSRFLSSWRVSFTAAALSTRSLHGGAPSRRRRRASPELQDASDPPSCRRYPAHVEQVFEPNWPSTTRVCPNGGGCPTYPKLWFVKSKRMIDCNRPTCCAIQPKGHSLGRRRFAKSSDNHCN